MTYYDYGSSNPKTATTSAFEEGLKIFMHDLTADAKKKQLLSTLKPAKLEDVLDDVLKAQKLYASKHEHSKVRKCVLAFSKRVQFYGTVMDVMVQHHPEYAALAWGAMKVVFGVTYLYPHASAS